MPANTPPNLNTPLVVEPSQSYPPAPTSDLGPLQHLIGTWTNQNIHNTNKGDTNSPYSYNVMPLPQKDPSSPYGYILKNFSYYEELTFSAIHGNAPNRGGSGTQVANTLFYEQRVYFAEGPNKDALVHAENGSLLYLTDRKQLLGPYGNGQDNGLGDRTVENSGIPSQPYNIVKQISVPHGNSVLAAGNYEQHSGSPEIGGFSQMPLNINTEPYRDAGVGNPNLSYTNNPNLPLTEALNVKSPSSYIHLYVNSSSIPGGGIRNIGFEQQHARVDIYTIDYWLEAFDGSSNFTQLQYSQNMVMEIPIPGHDIVRFPHVTTNTLTKVED